MISIAVDHTGADAARPFVEAAGLTFPTLIDAAGATGAAFGFKAVPNGVLADEAGVIRYTKYGGFSIDDEPDVAAVRRFLAGDDPGPGPVLEASYSLTAVERQLIGADLDRARRLAAEGERGQAVTAWRSALERDPENLWIRKQIWLVEHPDRFHPTIDGEWQVDQLRREQEAEVAQSICGPDGCPIPAAQPMEATIP